MTNPCNVAMELLGMFIGIGGWFCTLAATIMPQWLSHSTELMASESYEQGLWEACVVQDVAGTECRSYDTILGLGHTFTLARLLMCLSDATCLLGLLLAIPAMSQINCCKGEEGHRTKKGLRITAAVFLCLAGLLVITPVSYVAHDIVIKFFDETIPNVVPRSEFGDAMFIGWAAGFLDVVASILLFASSFGSRDYEHRLVYHHQRQEIITVDGSSKKRIEYV
ncbi:putative claudin-24 [Triplophysa tibetana]|uniref:Claudin n=1 Tax=Triplophysa tibetana TaxID=1572043 RepID=A0A5A9NUS6_9TELE|nr:putative claudin-24 [Triplophysa tibetana]